MRVCALVDSTQVESAGTRARKGASGPEPSVARTVTSCVVGPGLKTSIEEDPLATSSALRDRPLPLGLGRAGDDGQTRSVSRCSSCSSLATRRPVRVETVVATLAWSCTNGAMLSTCVWPDCEHDPLEVDGWTTPLGVAKLRSTTSGVEVGLKSATNSAFDPVVTPLGKYHCCEVLLWHGASAQPDGPCSVCDTATPPPDKVTASESHVPDVGRRDSGTQLAACRHRNRRRHRGARYRSPPSIVPVTVRVPVLVRTTEPGASCPAAVVCPVQYQADDSASGAPTRERRRRRRAAGRALPGRAGRDGHADEHRHDHDEDQPPALAALWAGAHDASSGRPPPAAGATSPTSAAARTTQPSTSTRTARGT